MARFSTNKRRSVGKFRNRASKTKRENMVSRGGFRL